jgi:hypothetical protein
MLLITTTSDRDTGERVKSFKFFGVHITEDLTRSSHASIAVKKAETTWHRPSDP